MLSATSRLRTAFAGLSDRVDYHKGTVGYFQPSSFQNRCTRRFSHKGNPIYRGFRGCECPYIV